MARWTAAGGAVVWEEEEEKLERRSGTPGSGVLVLKSEYCALTLAVHSS